MKKTLTLMGCSAALLGSVILMENNVSAHGHVQNPPARAYQGELDEALLGWNGALQKYGRAIDDFDGLEAPKGFPNNGPADGQLASAGGAVGDTILDIQTSLYWTKHDITSGINTFTWKYSAPHPTTKWHYYMTKQGWDQNKALTRADLELIETVNHDGSDADTNLSHQVNIPKDRSGYHVILAVWDVADTPNAFYNVIDVNVKGGDVTPEKPSTPSNVKAERVTESSVELSWDSQVNGTSFFVYRDGKQIAETSEPKFEDKSLESNKEYTYQIQAKNEEGISNKSQELKVKTLSEEVIEKPTAPSGLHTMEVTANSVNLMFTASVHSEGIKEYQIYRDGKKVGISTGTHYMDKALNKATTYEYHVIAVANNGEISEKSNVLKVTTEGKEEGGEGREFKFGSITSPESYATGEVVEYKNNSYKVLQGHSNYGDTTWAPDLAPALFGLI